MVIVCSADEFALKRLIDFFDADLKGRSLFNGVAMGKFYGIHRGHSSIQSNI